MRDSGRIGAQAQSAAIEAIARRFIGSSGVTKVAGERKPTGRAVRRGNERAVPPSAHLPETTPFPMIATMDLQHTVRCLVRGVPHIFLGGVPAERAGDDRLALHKLGLNPTGRPALSSDAFTDGAPIPVVHTADGDGTPPPLRWETPPPATRSLALLVEDPDAPTPNPFVHWVVTNIAPASGTLEQALAKGAHVGRNSMFRSGWAPCAPPKGDETHRYFFQLFALTRELRSGVSGRAALLSAIRGRVIGSSLLVGSYRR